MPSAKSEPNLWQIWHVFGLWASPYGAYGQRIMTVHSYRPRQLHRTSNWENPSSGYRDMGSTSLAAPRPPARPDRDDNTPPARRAEGLKANRYWKYQTKIFLCYFPRIARTLEGWRARKQIILNFIGQLAGHHTLWLPSSSQPCKFMDWYLCGTRASASNMAAGGNRYQSSSHRPKS